MYLHRISLFFKTIMRIYENIFNLFQRIQKPQVKTSGFKSSFTFLISLIVLKNSKSDPIFCAINVNLTHIRHGALPVVNDSAAVFPFAAPLPQSVSSLPPADEQLQPPLPHFSVCVSAHQDRSLSNGARSSNTFTFTFPQPVGDTLPLNSLNRPWRFALNQSAAWIKP